MNYSLIKRYFLALILATQKLRYSLFSSLSQSGHEVQSSQLFFISTSYLKMNHSIAFAME